VTSGIVLPVDDANFAGLTKTILLQGERYRRSAARSRRHGGNRISVSPERTAIQMPSLVLLDLSMPRMDGSDREQRHARFREIGLPAKHLFPDHAQWPMTRSKR
jgi:CheY-like chemotaxis protein